MKWYRNIFSAGHGEFWPAKPGRFVMSPQTDGTIVNWFSMGSPYVFRSRL